MTTGTEYIAPGRLSVARAADFGFPHESRVISYLSPFLRPDPRAIGKQHARDVISFDESGAPTECESIAHVDGTDDFARFRLLGDTPYGMVNGISNLLNHVGRVSVDYFRYAGGVVVGPHKDDFGTTVAIWVLSRTGAGGGANYLVRDNGLVAFHRVVSPGEILIFDNAAFKHGMEPLSNGYRDALIFIALKEGQQ